MGRWADSLEARASELMPEPVLRYVRQGARDSVSTAEAVAAWNSARLVPSVLQDVTTVDLAGRLLGTEVRLPVAIAPTTMQRAVHPEGELAVARGAAAAGSLVCVSSNAATSFADIGDTGVAWWLQMYLTAERELSIPVLNSAVAAGARAIVLTVDTPVVGTKYDDGQTVWELASAASLRVNFDRESLASPGAEKATDLGPADIGWLRARTGLPVVVKGVLRPSDARRCVDAGAAAIWVSNHGGRQLDRVVSTAEALAGVVAAVDEQAQVYVDGGIRTAHHVVTALAHGADAVFLGRPALYALAVGGAGGVQRLLDELADDLSETLRLLGCRSTRQLRSAGVLADGPGPRTREAPLGGSSEAEPNHTDVVRTRAEGGTKPSSRPQNRL